jgi:hypothetical protein
MHALLTRLGISSIIAIVGTIIIMNWLINEDPTQWFLSPVSVSEFSNTGISHLDIEFKNNAIHLNVALEKTMSCNQIINVLGVENLNVKEKIYVPVCKIINPKLAVITYREVTTI